MSKQCRHNWAYMKDADYGRRYVFFCRKCLDVKLVEKGDDY